MVIRLSPIGNHWVFKSWLVPGCALVSIDGGCTVQDKWNDTHCSCFTHQLQTPLFRNHERKCKHRYHRYSARTLGHPRSQWRHRCSAYPCRLRTVGIGILVFMATYDTSLLRHRCRRNAYTAVWWCHCRLDVHAWRHPIITSTQRRPISFPFRVIASLFRPDGRTHRGNTGWHCGRTAELIAATARFPRPQGFRYSRFSWRRQGGGARSLDAVGWRERGRLGRDSRSVLPTGLSPWSLGLVARSKGWRTKRRRDISDTEQRHRCSRTPMTRRIYKSIKGGVPTRCRKRTDVGAERQQGVLGFTPKQSIFVLLASAVRQERFRRPRPRRTKPSNDDRPYGARVVADPFHRSVPGLFAVNSNGDNISTTLGCRWFALQLTLFTGATHRLCIIFGRKR